jgi:GT2 family glycosyltransferase
MPECNQDALNLLAVIVLYKMKPAESMAFRSLEAAAAALGREQHRIQVLLYDNTPGARAPDLLPEGVRYEAAMRNAGLAAAYNRALSIARSQRCTWLLTLDQDTTLPVDYLCRIGRFAAGLQSDQRIAAIVPHLSDSGQPLSPLSVKFWGTSFLPKNFTGIPGGETRAFNSAALFRVSALEQIGGFDPRFWLDFVDVNVYRQLHLHGNKVFVAGEIEVEHELSVVHRGSLATDRFRNLLQAESAFYDLYEGPLQRFVFSGRLLGRIWRQWKRRDRPAIRKLTWKALTTRLLHSRRHRIQDWQRAMSERLSIPSDAQPEKALQERPAGSVCTPPTTGSVT